MPRWLDPFLGAYERELVCARCRNVMAFLKIRPLRHTRIQHVSGHEVHPYGGHAAVLAEEARLERFASERAARPGDITTAEVEWARRRVAYARAAFGEIVFMLVCECGADYLRSLPDLGKAARSSTGSRVELT